MSEDIYLRKDTFEETLKRIEAMMAAGEARTAALIADNNARLEVYRADSKRESESLASDIKAIRDTISDIKTAISSINDASARRWTIFGAVAGGTAIFLTFLQLLPVLKSVLGS